MFLLGMPNFAQYPLADFGPYPLSVFWFSSI